MKVILQENVKSVGKAGEVVEVSDGYARNFLLPKKLAIQADKASMNVLNQKNAKKERDEAKKLKSAKDLAAQLEEKGITVKMRAGANGKAFGSVSGKEIAQAALEQYGLEIDRKKIQLAEPIKSFGEFEVPIRLHPEVLAKLKVSIVELTA